MSSIDIPMEHPLDAWELPSNKVSTPHSLQRTEDLKQRSHHCAVTTTNLCASLALAATLSIDAGSNADAAALTLLVGSVVTAEMVKAYTALTNNGLQEDMYDVQYAEPITTPLLQDALVFETVLKNFTTDLLQLNTALHLVHLSYNRLQATMEAFENNHNDAEGALFLDAQLFSTLQRQALWRNLKLCTMLHENLLLLTPCINLLWHQFRLRVPSQARFNKHDVSETLTDIWQARSQDIATYRLNDFGITDCTAMLQIIEQQEVLMDPTLLIQDEWHKSIFLLTQSFQHALDTFYSK